jgi:hypothetical protein
VVRLRFAVVVVVLLGLHVFDPFAAAAPRLPASIPWDLGYHLMWMVAAAATVVWMTHRVWKDDP